MPAANGQYKPCSNCQKEIYLAKRRLERSKTHFCGVACANEYQARNKVQLVCSTCSTPFSVPKSEYQRSIDRGHKKLYCSIPCRNNDKQRMTEKAQLMNKAQYEKNGLNKLELMGREWLRGLGYIHNIDFFEQVVLFNKFCVDIFFPRERLVVQFDGNYWHSKPKRIKLDNSQDEYLRTCGISVFRITDTEMICKGTTLHSNIISRFLFVLMNGCNNTPIIPATTPKALKAA